MDVHALGDHQLRGRSLDVGAVRVRIRRDASRRDERPRVAPQELGITLVRGVDVQRRLERGLRPRRQLDESAELVHPKPVALAAVLDRVIRPAPGPDARESGAAVRRRPPVEGDRLRGGHPGQATRRDRAALVADVLGDGDEVVVPAKGVGLAELSPHLRESRVDVEEHPPWGGGEELVVREKAHHVDQHGRLPDAFQGLTARQPDRLVPVVEQEGVGLGEVEPVHDPGQPADARRARAPGGSAPGIRRHVRREVVDEDGLVAQKTKPQQILKKDPSVPTVARPLGHRPCDGDRRHAFD